MFDNELFYSLCKKYNVKLSKEYDRPMMRTETGVRELQIGDVENLLQKDASHKEVSFAMF